MGTSSSLWVTTARAYWDAGVSPLPRSAGSVEPATLSISGEVVSIPWGRYKDKQPDWETVERWFSTMPDAIQGITLLTGSHAHPRAQQSAFLQILDMETADVFEQWQEELMFLGHADILHRCVIERTPSQGAHVGFLCRDIGATQKMTLARRVTDNKILIELLQHQPCTVAPTMLAWKPEHPAGAAYTLTQGNWTHPYEISAEQRSILLACARGLNEVPMHVVAHQARGTQGDRPGDRLNARADIDWWRELLLRHDWHEVSRPGLASRGVYYFQRPGKVGREPSATFGMTGTYFYVFSSNAVPFQPDSAYSAFSAYALLEHAGNFALAARTLTKQFPEPHVPSFTATNGHLPRAEPEEPSACPELPDYAQVDAEQAAHASLWLDDYIAFSQQWAPRAYEGFHEASALFLLSTIAARRIKIILGPQGVYTSLYIALTARTSLFTKTTAASVALQLLRACGLEWFLADDESTPQAFLRSLTHSLPANYDRLSERNQDAIKHQMAFAAQRGWFYEEWGQHLEGMMKRDGHMADFRGILRRLDDHKPTLTYNTLSRGRETIEKPYLSLLATVTPADLKPFAKPQSPLWRDGYIARFAFVCPEADAISDAQFPPGEPRFNAAMIHELHDWHVALGLPTCDLVPVQDKRGEATGDYRVTEGAPLPERPFILSPDVWTAYYNYDRAMRDLTRQRNSEDLDGSYVRFPMKALRIAGLLASFHDVAKQSTIWMPAWARAQTITEHWRRDLHRLVQQVQYADLPTRQEKQERHICEVLQRKGALSIRDIHRWTKLPYTDIARHCELLLTAGVVKRIDTTRAKKYEWVTESAEETTDAS